MEIIGNKNTLFGFRTCLPAGKAFGFRISRLKRVSLRLISVICHLSFVIAATAAALPVNFDLSLTAKVEDDSLKIKILAINKDSEPAYNVQGEIRVFKDQLLAEKQAEVKGYNVYRAEMSVPVPALVPGAYPLILVLHYTDANGSPFTLLSGQTFAWQEEKASPVFGWLKSSSFSETGELYFGLKNLGRREINGEMSIVTPSELTASEGGSVHLPPGVEQGLIFNVKNFSALPGVVYPVLAVMEFEDGGWHYAGIYPATVGILSPRGTLFGFPPSLIIGILAATIIIFVGAQFFSLSPRRQVPLKEKKEREKENEAIASILRDLGEKP